MYDATEQGVVLSMTLVLLVLVLMLHRLLITTAQGMVERSWRRCANILLMTLLLVVMLSLVLQKLERC